MVLLNKYYFGDELNTSKLIQIYLFSSLLDKRKKKIVAEENLSHFIKDLNIF